MLVADVVAVVAPHARRQHDAPGPLWGAKAIVSLEHWQELADQVSCGRFFFTPYLALTLIGR